MSQLHVIATLVAKEGKKAELRAVLEDAVGKFREEDGCLAYALLEDQDDANRFVTVERWRDRAALDAHMHSKTMERIKPSLPALLGEEMKQQFLNQIFHA